MSRMTNSARRARWMTRGRRYLRSPKGYLTVALLALAAMGAPAAGLSGSVTVLVAATTGAVGMELVLDRVGGGRWRIPTGALLTGMIVGMVIGPHEPWYAAALAGVLAIDAKYVLRLGRSHVFNPAAAGLVAAYVLFASGQSWWGALPDMPAPAIAVLLVAGYVVADRANKMPAALAFLGTYTALFTLAAFAGAPSNVEEVFRPPFVNAALFFAFFMVTDPPTSPVVFRDQLWFGAFVAAAAFGIYQTAHAVYYLPSAILAGNALAAVWRMAAGRRPAMVRPRDAGGAPVGGHGA